MSKSNVIRAWKDPAYRSSLSQAETASLHANHAGSVEISDADLGKIAGGRWDPSIYCTVMAVCTFFCTHNSFC